MQSAPPVLAAPAPASPYTGLTAAQRARYRYFRTGSNTAARAFALARLPAQVDYTPGRVLGGVDDRYAGESSYSVQMGSRP